MAGWVPVVSFVGEVASQAPFTLVDIGCSGGIHPRWRQFGARLRAIAIDPNVIEITRLRTAETHPGVHYVAAYAGLSPGHPFLQSKKGRGDWHRDAWHRMSVVKSQEILSSRVRPPIGRAATDSSVTDPESPPVLVVPDYLRDNGVDSVDFLKIDIDGKDFEVLNSFDSFLENFGLLGLQLEVNFFGSALETDHSFHNTDRFMKARGFELFDLTGMRRYSLAALPSRYVHDSPGETEFGRILQADALYLRDLGFGEYRELAQRLGPEKLLNLVCLFAVFNLMDCAADIVRQFRGRLSSLCDPVRLLDLLAAQAQGPEGPHLSYRDWMMRFESQDDLFFPARTLPASQNSSQDGNPSGVDASSCVSGGGSRPTALSWFQDKRTGARLPSVAIIVRVMDRAEELRASLPTLLNQDYPNYSVVIVDHSSQDGLESVLDSLKGPRLRVVRCPRPDFFNRSRAGNIGVRYSFSDLLFFLDTGIRFRDEHHLSGIVATYLAGDEIDCRHYQQWRQKAGYPPLDVPYAPADPSDRRVYCECECHGLHLLVERKIFQQIGGLNEALLDWGYEDTDITTRLEISGYGRIPIRELVEGKHDDEPRVRFHREKAKARSWTRNRHISDSFIRTFGPTVRTQPSPGLCDWVEIDGVRYPGSEAPQQDWAMETAAELSTVRPSLRTHGRESTPLISVVIPTKNAAEYLVGCLDSILSQEYPRIECIVCDGGSTDATLDILASYGDRIAWTSHPDRGAFEAINRGWQSSRGEILAWLNADDSWVPGAAAAAVKCFQEDPEADIVYGDCLIVDADGRRLEKRRPPAWDLGWAVEACHHVIDQPAAFIRRAMAERVGWLHPAWFHDWDLWRRVSLAGGTIKRVPYLLGSARVRVDNSQYRPEILIDGLVGLTHRFFSSPSLPEDIRRLEPRALSNCYLRIVQTLEYGRPESRALRRKLRAKALVADPTNILNVLKTRPAGRRPVPAGAGRTNGVEPSRPSADHPFALLEPVLAAPPMEKVSTWQEPSPPVSVVIPCKNDIRFLPEALASILSQEYANLECIVVDGGSTDGTIDLLKSCGDRVTWVSEYDRGSFDAINRGWKLSRGEILAWLNADDLWEPGAVRAAVDFLARHPEVDVVYGNASVVDETGRVLGELVPRDWDLEYALCNCDHIIFQSASFLRRRILEKVGWLYPAWCHDHDLWLRIARAGGRFARFPTRLASDRMRSDNLGNLAELVVPAKIALTQRFFAVAELPPSIRRLQPRAMSSAYVRGVDYLVFDRPQHWLKAVRLFGQAVAADPGNLRNIADRFSRPFRWRARQLLKKS
jgi:FkbM family methyltransferase